MITTKAQELKALEKIKEIVDSLGENSYIGTAFNGAFEIAESNIEDDFSSSVQWYIDEYRKACGEIRELKEAYKKEQQEHADKVKNLEAELEQEQEWKPYEDGNVSQKEYDDLREAPVEYISDEKAAELVSKWFGFRRDAVEIIKEVAEYEINRHKRIRPVRYVARKPLYFATDMNYIRFDCCGLQYEVLNGELRMYCD